METHDLMTWTRDKWSWTKGVWVEDIKTQPDPAINESLLLLLTCPLESTLLNLFLLTLYPRGSSQGAEG